MKESYDFSNSVKNPYTSKLKKQITIRVDAETVEYFKKQALQTGITYQNLMNLYLRDCVEHKRTPAFTWTNL
ncbi:MAG: BrnA antitoxin family protein [Sphaerochaetaceae bacterium]|nr:BrnA antitoxin family protein [Sphaerochaetaceae bacterium]